MTGFSDYVVYVDESGSHDLTKPDPEFPVFVLSFCLFRVEDYIATVVPALQRIKFKHFGHDMVVFHERDIRKASGPFAFLTNTARRTAFMDDLNGWVQSSPFTIIAVVIRKTEFAARHSEASNPYHFAMQLGVERVEKHLKRRGQLDWPTHFVFEGRGKREDTELELEFRRVCDGANYRSQSFPFRFVLAQKSVISTGLQLADLTARPIGRHVIKPEQPNRAYDLILPKLDRSQTGAVDGWGLKCYP